MASNVQLSQDETYADLAPVRLVENTVTAHVSIMRGCNNMCERGVGFWCFARAVCGLCAGCD
jgi:hypothetical protein